MTVAFAGPASADPTTVYVTVGSPVTQDVMNQWALDQYPGLIGSWNATNPGDGAPHEVITPKPGCDFPRPVSSDEGLRDMMTFPRCIDFVRAAAGPGSNTTSTGSLQ